MRRDLLSRLRTNGVFYLLGALLLLLGIPLYQLLILTPLSYNLALNATAAGNFTPYLNWIATHNLLFLLYRILLVLAYALVLTLPFSLFRIIIAQELLDQREREEQEGAETDVPAAEAWRGKGFAVIAAWAGLFGLIAYILGTLGSTTYLFFASNGFTLSTPVPGNFTPIASIFSIISNTVGTGLLALSTLFFGAFIARRGLQLWPGSWVAFAYMALAVAALLSGAAVEVASAPVTGQAALVAPATILFALWVGWLGFMLVRLKPET